MISVTVFLLRDGFLLVTASNIFSGFARWDSGLEHHGQRRGHPFRNTVVRMPGPSWILKCWMLKIMPMILFHILLSYQSSKVYYTLFKKLIQLRTKVYFVLNSLRKFAKIEKR